MNEKEAKKFLEKIDNGEKLSESELRELCENAFQDDLGEQHRWTQTITSYVDLKNGGRVFAVEWERALTEMQENEYYNQPYEVEEVEEIVRVHKWVKKRVKKEEGDNMSLDEIKTLKKVHDNKLFEYEYNLNNILRNKFGKSNVSADLNYNHRTGRFYWTVYVKDSVVNAEKVISDVARDYGFRLSHYDDVFDKYITREKWNIYYYNDII